MEEITKGTPDGRKMHQFYLDLDKECKGNFPDYFLAFSQYTTELRGGREQRKETERIGDDSEFVLPPLCEKAKFVKFSK